MARTCNLIFIVLDVQKLLGDKAVIESELEGFGIRLNKKPPAITVKKKVGLCLTNLITAVLIHRMTWDKGGINITNMVPLTNIDGDEVVFSPRLW